jgi:coproporphyrinogen III oxidase
LVHDQNDEGILGSLPARVEQKLLRTWKGALPKPQGLLLDALLKVCGSDSLVEVDASLKKNLAQTLREHYQNHPETASYQASALLDPSESSDTI